MRGKTPLTFALLAMITIIWLFEVWVHAPDSNAKIEALGAITPHMLERGEYWRLVAAMFLHASWIHWAANSWALYQLGSLYEILFGSKRFAIVYFISGICASAASSMYQHEPAVGASGAIFGLLGAFIFSVRRSPRYRHQPWVRSLIAQLIFWIAVNIVIGFSIKYIDNVAHITGLVTGLILGFLPHREPPPPPGSYVIDVEPRDHAYGSE
jgi:rhomboid protease GluP